MNYQAWMLLSAYIFSLLCLWGINETWDYSSYYTECLKTERECICAYMIETYEIPIANKSNKIFQTSNAWNSTVIFADISKLDDYEIHRGKSIYDVLTMDDGNCHIGWRYPCYKYSHKDEEPKLSLTCSRYNDNYTPFIGIMITMTLFMGVARYIERW